MSIKFFKIFRAGTHTSMAGQTLSFSEQDVADIATFYPMVKKFAPLVLGHPVDDCPAYGMVTALRYKDGALFAEAEVNDELVDLVQKGRYGNVSASFFARGDSRNPVPGMWTLKHVGFLGAAAPAVKGLGELNFAESVSSGHYIGPGVGASFVGLRNRGSEVSFAEARGQRQSDYQRSREALHQAALRTVAAHPEFSYREAVRMFEPNF